VLFNGAVLRATRGLLRRLACEVTGRENVDCIGRFDSFISGLLLKRTVVS
jgi:hypothetical protein